MSLATQGVMAEGIMQSSENSTIPESAEAKRIENPETASWRGFSPL